MDARAREIIRRLKKLYPNPECALHFNNPFELMVATILSAQSTDAQVNKLTPALFAKYKSIRAFAQARPAELEKAVSSVNFYRNKAKNIQNSAKLIIGRFGGKVPESMEELIELPGVARKTANIILSSGFGIIEGIAVDTHVIRLSNLLGLTTHSDPVKIERDLMALIPRKQWAMLSHLLILHGRSICRARKPAHKDCVLSDICPSSNA